MVFGLTLDRGTAVVYFYSLGVFLSGMLVHRSMTAAEATSVSSAVLVAVSAVAAAVWTVYWELTLVERLPVRVDEEEDAE